MTYKQRYAALELQDKIQEFAEQYNLEDEFIVQIREAFKHQAKASTGIDIDEA